MARRRMPSKSEVVSLAHSAQIGVDCFMLSEETALSENKHITVSWLNKFLKSSSLKKHNYRKFTEQTDKEHSIWSTLEADTSLPVVVMSKSGRAISKLLSTGHSAEIFVISNSVKVTKLCQISSNKITNIIVDIDTTPTVDILWDTINENVDLMFQSSNELIAIYVSKYVNFPKANTITIFSRSDFD